MVGFLKFMYLVNAIILLVLSLYFIMNDFSFILTYASKVFVLLEQYKYYPLIAAFANVVIWFLCFMFVE